MSSLQMNLFGSFGAFLDGHPIENLGIKSQALLIYLAVERDSPHRRESLFTLLWPGMPEKSARHNLNQAVYALRQLIPQIPPKTAQDPVPLLLTNRSTIQLNPDPDLDVDIHKFEHLLESVQTHAHSYLGTCGFCNTALEGTLTLYQGDFLADFYLEDSNEFEEWAEAVREAYRHQLTGVLATLTDIAIHTGDHDQALTYIDRQLSIDELLERANRLKIEVLALAGRRVEAMRHYREFTQSLEDQLGTSPSQETTVLYERIQSEDLVASPERSQPSIPERVTPRTNLQPQPTPFIGRKKELAQLDEMLEDPDKRLITIVGPGGMGKTRLAIACAERQLHKGGSQTGSYVNGVFFVSLEAVDEPEQIPKEIVASLDLELNPGRMMDAGRQSVDPKQQLIENLRFKHMLLVLDNFEQLRAEGRFLADLLQVAPDIQILVTSREPLRLAGEHTYQIGGLSYPVNESIQDICGYTAIQLFRVCARRVRNDFELNADDLTFVTRICQLIEGMPLGLELAASWVDLLSVKEITAELEKSFEFLETDLVNIPERHRSLMAVCNSTWENLNAAQRDDFARLSVFRGGFTRKAAERVAEISLRSLGTLVKKSLLRFDVAIDRYRFHPYLRQFAAEKLAERPQEEYKNQDAHSAFYCVELKVCQQTFEAGQPHLAVEQIEKEFANIKDAWDWAVKFNLKRIDQSLDGLCHYFYWNKQYYDGWIILKVLDEKLVISLSRPSAFVDQIGDSQLFDRLHARVLIWGYFFCNFFDPPQAEKLYENGTRKLNALENTGIDVRLEKAQLQYFSAVYMAEKDLIEAKSRLLESVSFLNETDHPWWILACFTLLGSVNGALGFHQEAMNWLENGLTLAKRYQMQANQWDILLTLGLASRDIGDYPVAIGYYQDALSLASLYKIHIGVGFAHLELGNLFLFLGRLNESAEHLQKAIKKLEERFGDQKTTHSRGSLSIVYWLGGDFEKAETIILKAVDIAQNVDWGVLYPNICYIEFLALTGRYHRAADRIRGKADWSNKVDINSWPAMAGRVSQVLGWLDLIEFRDSIAIEHLKDSIVSFKKYDEFIAWSQSSLALANYRMGDREKARKLLIEALSTAIRIQAYIPIVFILPVTLLLLVEADLGLAKRIYMQIRRDRFMSNAKLIEDLVYKYLPVEITSLQVETVAHNDEHRETLWETARLVLAKISNDQGV